MDVVDPGRFGRTPIGKECKFPPVRECSPTFRRSAISLVVSGEMGGGSRAGTETQGPFLAGFPIEKAPSESAAKDGEAGFAGKIQPPFSRGSMKVNAWNR